jgi:hypothetical protein
MGSSLKFALFYPVVDGLLLLLAQIFEPVCGSLGFAAFVLPQFDRVKRSGFGVPGSIQIL